MKQICSGWSRAFSPALTMAFGKEGFSAAEVRPAAATSGAEALMFLDLSCRPEGLLHPVVDNVG